MPGISQYSRCARDSGGSRAGDLRALGKALMSEERNTRATGHSFLDAIATIQIPELRGRYIRLEALDGRHIEGLAAASAASPDLYQWSPVPQGKLDTSRYVETALCWREAGTTAPFAILRLSDGAVIGSTRFWNIEKWAWPAGHARYGQETPDACEIGYTWLTQTAVQTAANTEAKLLMLGHAFEVWQVFRVCFHTDARNQRSRAALERIGAKFEGILRSHRMAADYIPRDSVRYSILATEWADVKNRLKAKLNVRNHQPR
jgi:RimJ/RimL family protein N-acetyltransferase